MADRSSLSQGKGGITGTVASKEAPEDAHQALPVARKSKEGGACGLIRALLLYCQADLAID